jgi:hypothetical protein
VQDALDDEIAQLRHQDVGGREMAECHWERADMIMMTVGDGDGVDSAWFNQGVERQAAPAFAFGMDPGVQQKPVSLDLHKPCACPDLVGRIEIRDMHVAP